MQSSEIWDHTQLAVSLGVMHQIMPKLIDTFVTQTTKTFENLDSQSNEQLLITVHSLKGSAGQLFCKKLAVIAAKIEHELKAKHMDISFETRKQLRAELEAVVGLMTDYLRSTPTNE